MHLNLKFLCLVFFLAACTEDQEAGNPLTDADSVIETTMSREEGDAVYYQRLSALMDRSGAGGLSRYDPLKAVPGSPNPIALPRRSADETIIPRAALERAANYAANNNSSAFMVWHDGAIEFERYFGEHTPGRKIVSRSLSKPLATIAVGRAIEQGYVESLDQPAADFIQEWRDSDKSKITIRHLLGMMSGIAPRQNTEDGDNVWNKAYLHPFHDEIIINEMPLTHEPGSRYEYGNANADLIAPILERATGVSFENWLSEQVLGPLQAVGGEIWMNRSGGTPHSGCCALLPTETFLKLAVLMIKDGVWDGTRLLPEGFVSEMTKTTPQNPHAGLGVYVGTPYVERRGASNPEVLFGRTYHSEPYIADDLYLFDGNSNQVVYIVPSKNLIVLRTGGRPPREPEWDNSFLANTILRAL